MSAVVCCECGESLDPADDRTHWVHEPYCVIDDLCTCDLYVCAECCKGCTEDKPRVIPGQVSLDDIPVASTRGLPRMANP